MAEKRILLAEGDAALRALLAEHLAAEGLVVTAVGDGAAALAAPGPFDALILDAGLGDAALPAALRAQQGAPCLLLVTPGTDQATGEGEERLARPFRLALLLTRLRALLARAAAARPAPVPLGPFQFDSAGRQLLSGRRRIRLTDKEVAILDYLRRQPAGRADRETLLAAVWGYADGVTTHTLETHIYRLRRKITQGGGPDGLLVTEPGGYRLVV